MNSTTKIEHKSQMGADIDHTSYTLSLHHWSLLYDDYEKEILTPKFEIGHANMSKCAFGMYLATNHVEVLFFGEFKFHSLQASVSLLDKKLNKSLKAKSPVSKSQSNFTFNISKIWDHREFDQYVQNDTVTFVFELNIVKAMISTSVSTNTWNSKFNSSMLNRLQDIYKDSKFCDVTFDVDDELIPAHKIILAANSEPFQAMFMSQMKEQRESIVKIDDVDEEIFRTFLTYMYTGTVENWAEVVTELIVLADKYQVIDLIKDCESYMSVNVGIENATKYLIMAHKLNLKNLEENAVEFIKQNTQMLADPKEYKLLSDFPYLVTRIFR